MNEESKGNCEDLIQMAEVKEIIRNMALKKSLGSDGFPVEIYIFFWNEIGEILLNSINSAYQIGSL